MNEPLDRNKTDLTHNVTALAAAYLTARGFHPVETEVPVKKGWVADLASFCYPLEHETKKLKLIGGKSIVPEIESYEKFIFRYGHLLTAIVEVKTSRSDFTSDWKFKTKIYPANLCYIAYPKGLINKEELPAGWLGLEINLEGNTMLRFLAGQNSFLRHDSLHPQYPGETIDLITAITIRMEYRQKFMRHRAWWKAYRAGKILND